MTCDITDGRPRVTKHVTWRKGNNTLPTSGRYKLSDNGTVLTISSLSYTMDDGNYSCAATNSAGTGQFSTKFQLNVNCKCSPILSEMSVNVTLTDRKSKGSSYIAQYPILRTVQSALHFTSLTDLFTQTPSRLLWEASSHMLQLMREGCSCIYPPLSIARYSFNSAE